MTSLKFVTQTVFFYPNRSIPLHFENFEFSIKRTEFVSVTSLSLSESRASANAVHKGAMRHTLSTMGMTTLYVLMLEKWTAFKRAIGGLKYEPMPGGHVTVTISETTWTVGHNL